METIWRQEAEGIMYEYAMSPDSCTVRARVIAYNTVMGEAYEDNTEDEPLNFWALMGKAMDKAKVKLKALRNAV